MDEVADEAKGEEQPFGTLLLGALFIGFIWLVIFLIKDAIETKKLQARIEQHKIEKCETEKRAAQELWEKRHKYKNPKAINLGITCPILWSDINVGTSEANPYGERYIWCAVKPSLMFPKLSPIQTYSMSVEQLRILFSNNSGNFSGLKDYDAATKVFGQPWRTPTDKELQCLIEECQWEILSINGIIYWKVIGPNGNYILLPQSNCRNLVFPSYSEYWSCSTSKSNKSFTSENIIVFCSKMLRIFEHKKDIFSTELGSTEVHIDDRPRSETAYIRPVMDIKNPL